MLAQLAGRARSEADGAYWWTAPAQLPGPREQLYPAGGVDLGVAHGMAGVLPAARAGVCARGG